MCIIYSSVYECHTRCQSKIVALSTTCYNTRDPYVFIRTVIAFHVILITSNERLFL